MLSDILKERTASAHAELEKKLVAQIRVICSVEDYSNLLLTLLPYHQAIDRLLTPFLPSLYRAGETPGRTSNLLLDLQHFRKNRNDADQVYPELPEIDNAQKALGVMYVLEGSTLGGQHIAKMISSKLNMSPDQGFKFFNPYQSSTQARWQQFKDFLNDPRSVSNPDEVVQAANETFLTYNHWISAYESVNVG